MSKTDKNNAQAGEAKDEEKPKKWRLEISL